MKQWVLTKQSFRPEQLSELMNIAAGWSAAFMPSRQRLRVTGSPLSGPPVRTLYHAITITSVHSWRIETKLIYSQKSSKILGVNKPRSAKNAETSMLATDLEFLNYPIMMILQVEAKLHH